MTSEAPPRIGDHVGCASLVQCLFARAFARA